MEKKCGGFWTVAGWWLDNDCPLIGWLVDARKTFDWFCVNAICWQQFSGTDVMDGWRERKTTEGASKRTHARILRGPWNDGILYSFV